MEIMPVDIDGIEFSAVIDSTDTYSADAPSYTTEKGYSISDGVILKPLELSMTLYLTPTPVTWARRHEAGHVEDAIQRLQELYYERKPVTVTTNDRTYRSMAITSFELKRTPETGRALEIPITFQQVDTVETQTVAIPDSYGRSGATGVNAGIASVREVPYSDDYGADDALGDLLGGGKSLGKGLLDYFMGKK